MDFVKLTIELVALIFVITTHEAAHGIAAHFFGDDTARRMGRLTLNPIAHIDPLGSIILPLIMFLTHAPFLFGWAKPVPVDFAKLNPQKLGHFVVSSAGIAVNIMTSVAAALMLHLSTIPHSLGNDLLISVFQFSLMIACFNLIPILPLDGGRMLHALLPQPLKAKYGETEQYGSLILLALIVGPTILGAIGIDFNPIRMILLPMFKTLANLVLLITGHA
jgi:Zn-dependent protease